MIMSQKDWGYNLIAEVLFCMYMVLGSIPNIIHTDTLAARIFFLISEFLIHILEM